MGWYLPGAIVGAALGAIAYTQIQLEWLPILLAVFLIISTISYSWSENSVQPAFKVYPWYFLPSGFVFAFLSGIIGSTGPLLNPLYINYGLLKEDLIGTKSAHLINHPHHQNYHLWYLRRTQSNLSRLWFVDGIGSFSW